MRRRVDGAPRLVLRARRRAQPPRRAARQGAGCVARRHGTHPAQRPGHAARRDDALRHLLDARRLRRPCSRSATPRSTGCSRSRATPTTSPARAGLRILIDAGDGWRLLAVPSAFEIGLSDCRWIYRLDGRTVTVAGARLGRRPGDAVAHRGRGRALPLPRLRPASSSASASSTTPAASRSTPRGKRFAFRPDPASLWGQRYPDAVYHLVTGTPGRDRGDRRRRAALCRRRAARRRLRRAADPRRPAGFGFAVVGSLTDPAAAERLAAKYAARRRRRRRCWRRPRRYWQRRHPRACGSTGGGPGVAALDTLLPVARAQRDDPPHRAARARAV